MTTQWVDVVGSVHDVGDVDDVCVMEAGVGIAEIPQAPAAVSGRFNTRRTRGSSEWTTFCPRIRSNASRADVRACAR